MAEPMVLGDRYRAVGRLGAGGAGEVFLVRDRVFGRLRALKLLYKTRHGSRNTVRQRFLSEARLLAGMQHPNLVPVYDVGEHDERVYFVMEYAELGTLRDLYVESEHARPWQAAAMMAQVLSGLEYVHKNGVVHRDVKPANILVFGGQRYRLADFGVARFHDDHRPDLTNTGDYLGTVGYMAPEQRVDPRRADPRADIYAAGVTLFCLLTRASRPPPELYGVRFAIDHPEIPPALTAVVAKATRFDPRERYTSAARMREALEWAAATLTR